LILSRHKVLQRQDARKATAKEPDIDAAVEDAPGGVNAPLNWCALKKMLILETIPKSVEVVVSLNNKTIFPVFILRFLAQKQKLFAVGDEGVVLEFVLELHLLLKKLAI
jgi:hypothetical protein